MPAGEQCITTVNNRHGGLYFLAPALMLDNWFVLNSVNIEIFSIKQYPLDSREQDASNRPKLFLQTEQQPDKNVKTARAKTTWLAATVRPRLTYFGSKLFYANAETDFLYMRHTLLQPNSFCSETNLHSQTSKVNVLGHYYRWWLRSCICEYVDTRHLTTYSASERKVTV